VPPPAAAERYPSAAHHRVSADVVVLLDNDHGRTLIACADTSAESGGTRTGDHDIRLVIPIDVR
jgi:hypothetical protein